MAGGIIREEVIDKARLLLGDCRDILPSLERVDAVVTDPPYGIGIAANPVRQAHAKLDWDAEAPPTDLIAQCIAVRRIREANGDDAGPLFGEAA